MTIPFRREKLTVISTYGLAACNIAAALSVHKPIGAWNTMGNTPAIRNPRAVEPGDPGPTLEHSVVDKGLHDPVSVRVDGDELEREAVQIRTDAYEKTAPVSKPVPLLGNRGLVGSHGSLKVEDLVNESKLEEQEVEAYEESYVPLNFARERVQTMLQEMQHNREVNLLAFAEVQDCHELIYHEMRQKYEDYVETLKSKSLACIDNYKRALHDSRKSMNEKEIRHKRTQDALQTRVEEYQQAQEELQKKLTELQQELDSIPKEPPSPEKIEVPVHVPLPTIDPRLPILIANVEKLSLLRRPDLLDEYMGLERSRADSLERKEELASHDEAIGVLLAKAEESPGPDLSLMQASIVEAQDEALPNLPGTGGREHATDANLAHPEESSQNIKELEVKTLGVQMETQSPGKLPESGSDETVKRDDTTISSNVDMTNTSINTEEKQDPSSKEIPDTKDLVTAEKKEAEAVPVDPESKQADESITKTQNVEESQETKSQEPLPQEILETKIEEKTVEEEKASEDLESPSKQTKAGTEHRRPSADVLSDNRQVELEEKLIAKIEEQQKKIRHLEHKLKKLKSKGEAENAEAIAKIEPKLEKRQQYLATLREQLGVFQNMRSPGDDDDDEEESFPKIESSSGSSMQKSASQESASSNNIKADEEKFESSKKDSINEAVMESQKKNIEDSKDIESSSKTDRVSSLSKSDSSAKSLSHDSSAVTSSTTSMGTTSSMENDLESAEVHRSKNEKEEGLSELEEKISAASDDGPKSHDQASTKSNAQDKKLLKRLKEKEKEIEELTEQLREAQEQVSANESADTGSTKNGSKDDAAGAEGGAAKRYMEKLKAAEKKLKETEKLAKESKSKASRLEKELEKVQRQGGGDGGGRGGDGNSAKLKKELEDLKKKQKKQADEIEKTHAKAVRALEAQLSSTTEEATKLSQSLEAANATAKALQEKAILADQLEKENENLRQVAEEVSTLRKSVDAMTEERAELESLYLKEQKLRKEYWNKMEDMKGKIRVFARCRPMAQYELDRNCTQVVSFPDEFTVDVDSHKGLKSFVYDQCFGPDSTQDQIFEDTNNLIQSSLDGYNVCVFAYGQTGSGKTFTMVGSKEHPGLVRRSVTEIFAHREKSKATNDLTIKLYILEIYLDNLVDLLYTVLKKADPKLVPAQPPHLDIKKDQKGVVFVRGAQVVTVDSAEELLDFFDRANASRKVASTKMNAGSSRSHLVFSLILENTNKASKKTSIGKLSLVDLAGSERQDKTGATDERLKEAMSINKSLSALGDVISALSSGENFIPYRNNVLTQLMSDSLGGNAKTLMFVNISPANYNAEETVSSLTYASRVKLIKNNTTKSQQDEQVGVLRKLIREMMHEGKTPDPDLLKTLDLD